MLAPFISGINLHNMFVKEIKVSELQKILKPTFCLLDLYKQYRQPEQFFNREEKSGFALLEIFNNISQEHI